MGQFEIHNTTDDKITYQDKIYIYADDQEIGFIDQEIMKFSFPDGAKKLSLREKKLLSSNTVSTDITISPKKNKLIVGKNKNYKIPTLNSWFYCSLAVCGVPSFAALCKTIHDRDIVVVLGLGFVVFVILYLIKDISTFIKVLQANGRVKQYTIQYYIERINSIENTTVINNPAPLKVWIKNRIQNKILLVVLFFVSVVILLSNDVNIVMSLIFSSIIVFSIYWYGKSVKVETKGNNE